MLELGKIEYAEKIKNMLMEDQRTKDIEASFEMFENCREQGYRICNYNIADKPKIQTIAFSEHRNGDSIVVYASSRHEEYTFGYSDEFWENAKYFKYDDFDGAVEFIIEMLTK